MPVPYEQGSVSRFWVVPLRIFLGVMWLYAGIQKLNPEFGGIQRIVEVMAYGEPASPAGNPIEPFRDFLVNVVLPNWRVFGVLITAGEILVGLSLVFGIATRLGALVGVFLFFVYALGRAYLEWPPTYPILIVAHIILIWTAAGRKLGVDAWLAEKWPRWPLW